MLDLLQPNSRHRQLHRPWNDDRNVVMETPEIGIQFREGRYMQVSKLVCPNAHESSLSSQISTLKHARDARIRP